MKKTYFAPNTNIVKVELQQMVAASPQSVVLDKNATPIENGGSVGSRRGSIWDDEE